MKRCSLLFTIFIPIALCFSACNNSNVVDNTSTEEYTITFDSRGGEKIEDIHIKEGELLVLPENPTKEGAYFIGWYSEEYNLKYNQIQPTKDVNLYAKWCTHVFQKTNTTAGITVLEKDEEDKIVTTISIESEKDIITVTETKEKAPTCVDTGNSSELICSKCGVLKSSEPIPATGHSPDSNCICTTCGKSAHDYKEGTCATCGITVYSREGEYLLFGSYPQTRVTDTLIIMSLNLTMSLNSLSGNNSWTSYNYYLNGEISDYMWYQDILFDGERYRGVYFTSYRSSKISYDSNKNNSYQDENGYYTSEVNWFKYEPIKWRILSEDGGEALILCEMIIDSQEYHDNFSIRTIDDSTVHANNYAYSNIRTFLNETFYNTAFSDLQKEIIKATTVDNSAESTNPDNNEKYWNDGENNNYCSNSTDNVFLLSVKEASTKIYGFDESVETMDFVRQKTVSDYAQCQGVYTDSSQNTGWWWLRSPNCHNSKYARDVRDNGDITHYTFVDMTIGGIVPALTISIN